MEGARQVTSRMGRLFKIVPDYTILILKFLRTEISGPAFGSAEGTFSKDGKLRKEDYWKMLLRGARQ